MVRFRRRQAPVPVGAPAGAAAQGPGAAHAGGPPPGGRDHEGSGYRGHEDEGGGYGGGGCDGSALGYLEDAVPGAQPLVPVAVEGGSGMPGVTEVLPRPDRAVDTANAPATHTPTPAAIPTAIPAEAHAAHDHTQVLDPTVSASAHDPAAHTQVISRDGFPDGATFDGVTAPGRPAPEPLVSRRMAAEIGMYAGASLVLVAVGGVAVRGWGDWTIAMRATISVLASLGLVAAGLFVRLPLSRPLGPERRRAISTLLVAGVGTGLAGVSAVLGAEGAATAAGAAAVVGVLGFVLVNAAARTALSETALLGALAWLTWVVLPDRPARWAAVLGLGVAWVLLGVRWAAGRRTAAVAGASLSLAAAVGVAVGPWALPARLGLAVVTVLGLGAFLRGRANYWLALGAASATALAASVAGDVVSPALALLVGGLATMAVSGIALRHARRS